MAEDDTLFYDDKAPEPNARDTVEVSGPWGTLTLRPSPALAEELAQLSHIGWDGIGSPERSLEEAAARFVQSVQTMVRIEGHDPKHGVDLGDPTTNPYLRRQSGDGGLSGVMLGRMGVFGGSATRQHQAALTALRVIQSEVLGGKDPERLLDDPDPALRDMHKGILAGWRRLTAEAQPDLGSLLERGYDGVQTVHPDDGVELRRFEDLSDPKFTLDNPTTTRLPVDEWPLLETASEPKPIRADGLDDEDIQDITEASPGPDPM